MAPLSHNFETAYWSNLRNTCIAASFLIIRPRAFKAAFSANPISRGDVHNICLLPKYGAVTPSQPWSSIMLWNRSAESKQKQESSLVSGNHSEWIWWRCQQTKCGIMHGPLRIRWMPCNWKRIRDLFAGSLEGDKLLHNLVYYKACITCLQCSNINNEAMPQCKRLVLCNGDNHNVSISKQQDISKGTDVIDGTILVSSSLEMTE